MLSRILEHVNRLRRPGDREVWIIVGLGNPGREYAHTRHNVGWDVLEKLSERWRIPVSKKKLGGELGEADVKGRRVVLCRPLTFMNLSGQCVAQLMRWYHAEPKNILLIYDDVDLPTGRVRMRLNGGPGTHNGMRSVVGETGSQDFPRIRVGIGSRPKEIELKDWVLGRPATREEQEVMAAAFEHAANAAEIWLTEGPDAAMRAANSPIKAI